MDYPSVLTGAQMDSALLDVAQHNSEAWAVGKRNGFDVQSGDATFNNNSWYWATQAQTWAGVAQGAIPSGTAGAVFFDRAQSLIYSQQTQARANIRAGNYNRNLLDNWYFPTAVNQRGFTSTSSSNTNTIDRWKNLASYTVTYSDGKISIPANGVFGQNIEPDLYDYLVGRTVTLSVLYNSGSIASGSMTVPSTGGAYASNTPRMGMNGDSKRFYIYPPESVEVRAFKLELGSYSTLINDVPPNYAEELAKCRFYFRRYKNAASSAVNTLVGGCVLTNVSDYILDGEMRNVAGTTTYSGSITVNGQAATNVLTYNRGGQITLRINTGGGLTQYQVAIAAFAAGAYIDISHDL